MSKQPRHQSVISRQSDAENNDNHWLKRFEETLQKTSVQPRGQSTYDQISSIMNTKSKYTSVQNAVENMMDRSGLKLYLDNVKNSKEETSVQSKKATLEENFYQRGFNDGKEDKKNQGFGSDILGAILSQIRPISRNHKAYMEYANGYVKGCDMPKAFIEKELSKVSKYIERNKTAQQTPAVNEKKDTSGNKDPQVITEKPSIARTLDNLIKESKGNLPIPAIIAKLHALHSQDISDEAAWDDERLLRLVSQLNLQAKKDNPSNYENFDQLGRGDHSNDADIDASNTDAFSALQPATI